MRTLYIVAALVSWSTLSYADDQLIARFPIAQGVRTAMMITGRPSVTSSVTRIHQTFLGCVRSAHQCGHPRSP